MTIPKIISGPGGSCCVTPAGTMTDLDNLDPR
jgi:hypothetical protein